MNLENIQLDQQKKILIVIFCVLIAYVDLTYILKAQTSGLKGVDLKIMRLEKDTKDLNRDLEIMRNSKGKDGLISKDASGSSRIMAEGQISGLLQEISSTANKFNIKIIQITPKRETSKSVVPGDKFVPILITLDMVCDYHSLGKFINALENSLIFMGVAELKILNRPSEYLKQGVSLIVRTYVSK